MALNVFKDYSADARFYLTHPLRFLKESWTNVKSAWQRATKGYCPMDIWSMDNWMLEILPQMLVDLAHNGYGYPGVEPFETPEKWHTWLLDMAAKLINCKMDDFDERNPYAAAYKDALDNDKLVEYYTDENGYHGMRFSTDPEFQELSKKFHEADAALASRIREDRVEVFKALAENLHLLWD